MQKERCKMQQGPQYPQSSYDQPQYPAQTPDSNAPYPPQPQPPYMPVQTPQQPPKRPKTWLWIGAIIVALLIGYGAGASSHASDTTTNTTNTTTQANTSVQPTAKPTQPPKPTAAPKWTTTNTFNGNGAKKTAIFSVGDDWKIQWKCNPASFDNIQYNVIIDVNNSDGTPADPGAINTLCKPGNTSGETEEHQGGSVYLDIQSEGDWTITIQQLK
jgi:hypothetical protein